MVGGQKLVGVKLVVVVRVKAKVEARVNGEVITVRSSTSTRVRANAKMMSQDPRVVVTKAIEGQETEI